MTTKTGSTELRHVVDGCLGGEVHVAFKMQRGEQFESYLSQSGGLLQLSTVHYVWYAYTSAQTCLADPLRVLAHPWSADPWGRTIVFVDAFALFMWFISLRTLPATGTSDPSIVDRLWSLMPWIYCWHWFGASCVHGFNPRLFIMTVIASIWGFRLTYNFWIKGGFSGGEDYRWAVIRRWYPGWKWEVFNLVFICLFQQCAILAFSAPAVAALQSEKPLTWLDALSAVLYLLLCLGEAVADAQMFAFQTEKYRRRAAGEEMGPYAKGFIQTGLWAWSRHPNYFCEVTMWWVFYLFSIPATGKALNWTIWGPLFLSGLFLIPGASLDITESLSSSKYPEYARYQQHVSKFFPLPPRRKEGLLAEA
ncbi:unnamed protein product [Symbiodinium natans]|uniref:Steroid 5-alpha reductase C-terminal domain-containing protein n=1 Tax=Symbiodinium natans TaxID=878477 RepID=A0A812KS29_9DINO|nr:unnamed protein product [Symbiodinium natans]